MSTDTVVPSRGFRLYEPSCYMVSFNLALGVANFALRLVVEASIPDQGFIGNV